MGNKRSKRKLNTRRLIVLMVLLIIILLILFGIIKLFTSIFAKEEIAGNNSKINMGLAINTKDAVYYNKYEKGIVKLKGKEEYQITDETAYAMTLIEDTIYYITVSSTNTIDLKKVKTNGDGLEKIKTISTSISKFYIEDKYLYYANDKDTAGIAKLSLENVGEESIIVASSIRDFVLDNGIIYYTDNVGYLHSVTTNGTDKKEVLTENNISNIQILKKWIYFYDEKENALCKIKKDGSSKKIVATFVNNEMYNVTSKKIYYFDAINKQICSSDLNGKRSKPIVSLEATRTKINIVGNVLYYLDNSKNENQIYQMYRVKTNGGHTKSIDY